jgi:hypothetical protein
MLKFALNNKNNKNKIIKQNFNNKRVMWRKFAAINREKKYINEMDGL